MVPNESIMWLHYVVYNVLYLELYHVILCFVLYVIVFWIMLRCTGIMLSICVPVLNSKIIYIGVS